ncbi:hypothetical protein CMV14_12480 [Rhizorhabdus dicambivorans]|nr:hypothetical protein CMV14_12480 [Rhizorhabdus dicambivorans]
MHYPFTTTLALAVGLFLFVALRLIVGAGRRAPRRQAGFRRFEAKCRLVRTRIRTRQASFQY